MAERVYGRPGYRRPEERDRLRAGGTRRRWRANRRGDRNADHTRRQSDKDADSCEYGEIAVGSDVNGDWEGDPEPDAHGKCHENERANVDGFGPRGDPDENYDSRQDTYSSDFPFRRQSRRNNQ